MELSIDQNLHGGVKSTFYTNPQILNTTESLKLILENKHSIARFGDVEFSLIRGVDLGFQKANDELNRKLIEIHEKRIERLEISILDVFEGVSEYNDKAARFWRAYMGMYRGELIRLINFSD